MNGRPQDGGHQAGKLASKFLGATTPHIILYGLCAAPGKGTIQDFIVIVLLLLLCSVSPCTHETGWATLFIFLLRTTILPMHVLLYSVASVT